MHLNFWDVYRDIRSIIEQPDEALYIVHTSIGAITISRLLNRAEAGYVFLEGIDENGRERVAGFSEEQLSTFPLEVRTRSTDQTRQIQFHQSLNENPAPSPATCRVIAINERHHAQVDRGILFGLRTLPTCEPERS